MSDERDEGIERVRELLREGYHAPPPTPRDEMWAAIEARLAPRDGEASSLDAAGGSPDVRRALRRRRHRPVGWAVAAAALLVAGIGIGRWSTRTEPDATVAASREPDDAVLRAAALDHLGQTESLLTLVRADGRRGRLEAGTGAWARMLLTQTRLLLDSKENEDPAMRGLLEDLELVLAQIVGVSEAQSHDGDRARAELNMALQGLEEGDVLPRIRAVVPPGTGLSGT